ncbi:hypothetical protein SH601_03555 [Gracilibacillus sp. S3-1-1]|uniref:Uncharacterized protein n=1 Tax=Gracilibacillus pellucidus TaxID=3095368 RepID=A0ACC6M2D5_9BACI|nr:hypothetical protein [Gracilibacillus sp. S3-1-1]MDX8045053.1 hypothetical protein [Gracilibacillus sp. S3-1-1]
MKKSATINEVTVAFLSLTLVLLTLAWKSGSLIIGILALISLSINFFIDGWKEHKKGQSFFFAQSISRGIGIIGILTIVFIYL